MEVKPLHPPLCLSHVIPRSFPLSLRGRGLFSSQSQPLLQDSNSISPTQDFVYYVFALITLKSQTLKLLPFVNKQIPVSQNLKTDTTFMNLTMPSRCRGKLPSSYWYTCWGNWFLLSQSLHSHCSFTPHILPVGLSAPLPHRLSFLKRQQTTRSMNPLAYLQSSFSPTQQHWNPNVIYSTALCSPPSSFPFPPNTPSSLVTDPFPQLSILPLGLSYKTDSQRFPCFSKPQANLSNCLCYIATGLAHWHSTAALIVLSPNLYILASDAASSQHPKPGSEYYLFPFVSLPCLISS